MAITDPKGVLEFARDNAVEVVDLRFCDLLGTWQHFSVPITELTLESFEEGFGFDGSSVRGWKAIHESDMLVMPDPSTAWLDPFTQRPTLILHGNVHDCITREPYTREPRNIARKAEAYLKQSGIGDVAYFGPELEFFIFDNVRYGATVNHAFYEVDSSEGIWNSGSTDGKNLGYKVRHKEGYLPVAPADSLQDLRTEMIREMIRAGMTVERQHHEVATAGQAEIDIRYDSLVRQGDNVMRYKYITRNVAVRHGKTVTFMPKPLFGDNGTGMHTHFSIWKGGRNLFAGDGYAGMSEMGLHAIGGVLRHAPAILALSNPTTNSYKRLVPGYEAPVNLAYSSRNRSAAIRIPMYSPSPKAKRFEFRCPDPASNPYLTFATILMAAVDGIQRKIDPGAPLDKDIYDLPPEELKDVPSTPPTLAHALDALQRDHEFLLRGDVFTDDVIRTWIEIKRKKEVDQIALRPHPYEYHLYFDA